MVNVLPCESQPSGPYGECYGEDYNSYYYYEAQMQAAHAQYWAMMQQQQQQPFPQSNAMPTAADDEGYNLWQAAIATQEGENELVQAIVDETAWTMPSIADSAAAIATNSSNTTSSEISGSVVDGTEETKKKKRRSRRSAKRISRAAQQRRVQEDEDEERAARAERESRRGRTYSLPPAAREDSDVPRIRRIRSCSAPPVPADFISGFDQELLAIVQEDSASSDLMSVGPSEGRSTGADTPDRMGIRCASSIYQSTSLSTNGLFA